MADLPLSGMLQAIGSVENPTLPATNKIPLRYLVCDVLVWIPISNVFLSPSLHQYQITGRIPLAITQCLRPGGGLQWHSALIPMVCNTPEELSHTESLDLTHPPAPVTS